MSRYNRLRYPQAWRWLARGAALLACLVLGTGPMGAQAAAGTRIYLPLLCQASVPVQILASTLAHGRGGTTGIDGTLVNTGAVPLTDIVVRRRLYNETGGVVFASTGTTWIPVALPGQPLPFSLGIGTATGARVAFDIASWTEVPQTATRALTVRSLTISYQASAVTEFAVVLQNDTPTALNNIQLLLWSLPLGESDPQQTLPDTLAPGEQITVQAARYYIDSARTIAIAQGQVVSEPAVRAVVPADYLRLPSHWTHSAKTSWPAP